MNASDTRALEKKRLDFVETNGLQILDVMRDCKVFQERKIKEYVDLAEKSKTADLRQVYLDLIAEEMKKLAKYDRLKREFEEFWSRR